MKILSNVKAWLHRKKRLHAAIHAIKHSRNPRTRPDAVYEFLSIKLEDITRDRPLSLGEFQIVSAMFIGNVIVQCPNRQRKMVAFRDIDRLARELVKNVETRGGA